jgi:small-conductance mechanosensitive channel
MGSMFEVLSDLKNHLAISEALLTLLFDTGILLIAVVILRSVASRFIKKKIKSRELQRRWLVQIRNGLILLLTLGLIFIWGDALRTFTLSIVAIAVAFVVATKELILCMIGSVIKTGSGSFDIGDRIQIKDFRGDVIDHNILATTILEVGPGKLTHQRTGRMTVIPNALFVSEPIINESYTHDYVLHVFTVPFKKEENWQEAKEKILEAAKKWCSPYLKDAQLHMEKLSEEKGLDIPTSEPRVSLQVPSASEIHLIVRLPVEPTRRSFIEQSILSDVFSNNDFSMKKEGSE